MSIPNPDPTIFVPGKVIQVRSPQNPVVVSQLALISVEEHVRQVSEILNWIYPDASPLQRAAAELHDIGKKAGTHVRVKGVSASNQRQVLLADFYGEAHGGSHVRPADIGLWYREVFLGIKNGELASPSIHLRLWPAMDGSDIRMDLDPPFGNHAADATDDDLRRYRAGALDFERDGKDRAYVLSLVRLHHSFQPDRLVGACARHGGVLVTDLYRLIVADHLGSRWAEYAVQQVEAGLEMPDREDFFGDVQVGVVQEPHFLEDRGELKVASVRLRRGGLPHEQGIPLEKELMVAFFPMTVNWDLRQLAEQQERLASQKSPARPPRGRGGRRGGR